MDSENQMITRIEHLSPGCFAIVMATGIVSIDLSQHGMPWLARALLALNCVVYIWLLILSVWRVLAWPGAVQRDFVNPARGAAFLTPNQFLIIMY